MKKELKKIYELLTKPYMRILPGNLAFSFMVAIIPIISIIVFMLNVFNISSPSVLSKLTSFIPEAVLDILSVFLKSNAWNSALLLIVGFWTASSGMHALIIASNVVYDFNGGRYIERRVKSLLLTFLIILIIIINLGVLVFGDTVVKFIINIFSLPSIILALFSAFKWPIAIIPIYFVVKIIYTAVPDVPIKSKYVTKGAVFTTLLWLLASALYSFYVSNIVDYSIKYGSLSNIIILLVWLYILSYILVLGTAINVNQYNKSLK